MDPLATPPFFIPTDREANRRNLLFLRRLIDA